MASIGASVSRRRIVNRAPAGSFISDMRSYVGAILNGKLVNDVFQVFQIPLIFGARIEVVFHYIEVETSIETYQLIIERGDDFV